MEVLFKTFFFRCLDLTSKSILVHFNPKLGFFFYILKLSHADGEFYSKNKFAASATLVQTALFACMLCIIDFGSIFQSQSSFNSSLIRFFFIFASLIAILAVKLLIKANATTKQIFSLILFSSTAFALFYISSNENWFSFSKGYSFLFRKLLISQKFVFGIVNGLVISSYFTIMHHYTYVGSSYTEISGLFNCLQ